MWVESRHQSPDEAWYYSSRNVDAAWTLMVAATTSGGNGHSAWCKLLTPDMTGTWSDAGVTTTAECHELVRSLFAGAAREGYEPPELDELLSMIQDGKVEDMIDALRTHPLAAV